MIAHRRGRVIEIAEDRRKPIRLAPRPMRGLLDALTTEQKAKALAYRGPENHASPG